MAAQDPLSPIEAQLQELQAALLSSDPITLEQGAQALREAAASLVQAQQGQALDEPAQARLRTIARQLAQLREQLARVLALSERQAASLLPPVDPVTYGPSSATPARIYRAPG